MLEQYKENEKEGEIGGQAEEQDCTSYFTGLEVGEGEQEDMNNAEFISDSATRQTNGFKIVYQNIGKCRNRTQT